MSKARAGMDRALSFANPLSRGRRAWRQVWSERLALEAKKCPA
jgi:hypothetical protein